LGNEKEYNSLRSSMLTAYYTPPEFAQRIWQAVDRMGHRGGAVLEPAVGNGIFLETAPENNTFTCVEKDDISAKIAQYVYPNANVYHSSYQEVAMPEKSFDLAISNVPFADIAVIEPPNVATPTISRADKFNLHNFYFAKTMHGIKDNGLIAFVSSHYTMDSQNLAIREKLAQNCDFIAAIRMPDKTFKANAETSVVSDIIFLQKRPPEKEMSQLTKSFINTGEIEINSEKIPMNQYFIDNPDMIIGELEVKNFQGKSLNVSIDKTENIYPQLDKIIEKLPQNIKEPVIQEQRSPVYLAKSENLLLDNDVKMLNGKIHTYNIETGNYEKSELYEKLAELEKLDRNTMNRSEKTKHTKEISNIRLAIDITPKFINMKNLTNEVVQDTIMGNTLKAQEKHTQLNLLYDDFVKNQGFLHENKIINILSQYPEYTKVTALEKWNKISKTGEKADLLKTVPTFQRQNIDKAKTLEDAFILSLYNVGKVDVEYIKSLLDEQEEYPDIHSIETALIEKQLSFPNAATFNANGNIVFETAESALSGNVRQKYKEAVIACQSNEEYFLSYRDEIEKVIPKDLLPEDITLKLSSVVLDNKFREEFVRGILGDDNNACKVNVLANGDFKISIKGNLNTAQNMITYAVKTLDTPEFKGYECTGAEVLQHILNGSTTPNLTFKTKNSDGSTTVKFNVPAANAFKKKMNEVEDAFKNWIFTDPDRTEQICRKYNDVMNNYVNAEYVHPLRRIDSQAQIRFPNSFFPYPARTHQADAVHRVLTSKNAMLAHCVGAGKTFEMITSSMEAKRLGLSNKPLHVVPNHMLNQYSADFYQMYPQANLLIADTESVKPAQRQEFFNQMAMGNYDAIIIKQSSFEKLSVSPEFERKFIDQELSNLERFLNDMDDADRNKKNTTFKDVQKRIEKLEEKLKSNIERIDADKNNFYFDQMGIDRMYIDEADMYKNLSYVTKMSNIKGLGTAAGSQKAFDLYMKTQYLNQNDGAIVFATGTPISNSLVEAYTMQRYLQPELLENLNVKSFDQWASLYAEVSRELELNNTGTDYKPATRFSKIVNVPELTTQLRDVWDVKQQDFLIKEGILTRGENLPHLNKKVIAIPSNQLIESYRQYLVEREENLKHIDTRQKGADNVLCVINDGKMAALDMRLISPIAPNLPFSKLNVGANYAFEVYKNTMPEKGTIAIFFDKGTDKKTDFSAYDALKAELIAKGIPSEEIIIASELDNDDKKQAVFDKMNDGDARIIIGSTQKMGAGTNIQERLHTIIHLDIPLRPRDLEQRLGRIDRQGNNWSQVDEVFIVQKGSLDSGLLHLNEVKSGFIGKILSGNENSRSIEEDSLADIKELSIEDPLMKKSMQLRQDIKDLQLQEKIFRDNYSVASREIKRIEPLVAQNNKIISILKEFELPKKETLTYDEKELQNTLKLEVGGKNLAAEKEPFKNFRKIIDEQLIPKTISQFNKGDVCETLDVKCQNIDFKIQAIGTFGKLQSLDIIYNVNGENITNKLSSSASGQTIVNKMLETVNEKVVQKIDYLEKQNASNQKALEAYQKKTETSIFPHKDTIIQSQKELDIIVNEISERQSIQRVERERHLEELKAKGIEITEIKWEKIEHKKPEALSFIDTSKDIQSMINLAGSKIPEGKIMPDLEIKNSLETNEKPYLKLKGEKISEPVNKENLNTKENLIPEEKTTPEKADLNTKENLIPEEKTTPEPAKEIKEIKEPSATLKAQAATGNLFGISDSEKSEKTKRQRATDMTRQPRESRNAGQLSMFERPEQKGEPANLVWIKMKDSRFDNAESYGDKNDKLKRVYLLTKAGVTELSVPNGKIDENGKSGKVILATSKDISVDKMKTLIKEQYNDLMAGKGLVYEKEPHHEPPPSKKETDFEMSL
jgi:N12 class adenine-specific DNA methylase